MFHRSLAAAALTVLASTGASAQSSISTPSGPSTPAGMTVGPSQPSVPSVPSGSIYSRSTAAVPGASLPGAVVPDTGAAGRDRGTGMSSLSPSGGIDPAYRDMDSRRDTAAMGAPAMGAMYLNGRVDDVRKTCPPGLVKRDYRCAPPPDGVMRP